MDNVISGNFSAIMNFNAFLRFNLNIDTASGTSAFKGGDFLSLQVLETPQQLPFVPKIAFCKGGRV